MRFEQGEHGQVLYVLAIEDYELLFASLDCLRRSSNRRSRARIRDLTAKAIARAASIAEDGQERELRIAGEEKDLVLGAVQGFARHVISADEASQAECHLAAHALSVLDAAQVGIRDETSWIAP